MSHFYDDSKAQEIQDWIINKIQDKCTTANPLILSQYIVALMDGLMERSNELNVREVLKDQLDDFIVDVSNFVSELMNAVERGLFREKPNPFLGKSPPSGLVDITIVCILKERECYED